MTSKEKKPPLTPETTFCPNFDCPARGQIGEGNIGVHSQKDRRYICRECKVTFSATIGTLFYRSRKGADLITLVVKFLSHGCPVQAIVFAFGLDERTRQTLRLGFGGCDSLLRRWLGELSDRHQECLSRERASPGNRTISLHRMARHSDRASHQADGASAIGTKFARWSDTPCAASVRPPVEVHFRTGKFAF